MVNWWFTYMGSSIYIHGTWALDLRNWATKVILICEHSFIFSHWISLNRPLTFVRFTLGHPIDRDRGIYLVRTFIAFVKTLPVAEYVQVFVVLSLSPLQSPPLSVYYIVRYLSSVTLRGVSSKGPIRELHTCVLSLFNSAALLAAKFICMAALGICRL